MRGRIVIVQPDQTLTDIAIQECGTFAAKAAIAKASGINSNTRLTTGMELIIPPDAPMNKSVADYYKTNEIKPATAYTAGEGIGYDLIPLIIY